MSEERENFHHLHPQNRQIQVRIIQIPPRARELPSQSVFPDPADLLLQDGNAAASNIIRSATSLPTPVHTREIRLSQFSGSTSPRSSSDLHDSRFDDFGEGSQTPPTEASSEPSTCRCHVMRMADNTILWFVVNDVEIGRRTRTTRTRCPPIPETVSTAQSSGSGPFCRICFLGSEDGPLIRVCHCRGTVGLVHHHCVLTWSMQRQCYSCEICHYSYNLQVNGLRWCWKWVFPVPRGQLATQCLLFTMSWIVMVFSIASLVFITFNLSTIFPDEITAGVFIIMNSFTLLCSVGILLTQSLYPIRSICHRFCLANLELEILPYEESDETIARSARTRNQCPSPASTSQPYSISSPNLALRSISERQHPMSIPSVQLNELVRSNQMVLDSLQEPNSTRNNQTQTQSTSPQQQQSEVPRSRWRRCSVS